MSVLATRIAWIAAVLAPAALHAPAQTMHAVLTELQGVHGRSVTGPEASSPMAASRSARS